VTRILLAAGSRSADVALLLTGAQKMMARRAINWMLNAGLAEDRRDGIERTVVGSLVTDGRRTVRRWTDGPKKFARVGYQLIVT
jgi:hypothetical protein